MDKLTSSLLNTLLPARCVLCKLTTEVSGGLCSCCNTDLTIFDYQNIDNLLLRPDIERGIKLPQFDRLISLAPYQWPYDLWITDMKFRENYHLADLMAAQLSQLLLNLADRAAQHSTQFLPNVILPMPIHRNRRFIRGYNQAMLIAKVLATQLDLKINNKALKRIKSTCAQSELSQAARQANVKQAFVYQGPAYCHVALVDDVITTGATVNSVCKVLREQGVKLISVWTICATPLKSRK